MANSEIGDLETTLPWISATEIFFYGFPWGMDWLNWLSVQVPRNAIPLPWRGCLPSRAADGVQVQLSHLGSHRGEGRDLRYLSRDSSVSSIYAEPVTAGLCLSYIAGSNQRHLCSWDSKNKTSGVNTHPLEKKTWKYGEGIDSVLWVSFPLNDLVVTSLYFN